MRLGHWRPLVAGFVLFLGVAGYVAAPLTAGASTPRLTAQTLPAAAGPLSGAVVVGPGGASTGYYTRISVMTTGSSLTFINLDQLAHTVTSVARKPDGSPLFNGNALPGKTAKVEGVEKLPAGTYQFYCQFHPNMTGELIVEGQGNPPIKTGPPKFVSPLNIPKVLTGSHITIPVKLANVRIKPHGPKTRMWTFDGMYPGPTIRRPAGHRTTVTFVNHLPGYVGDITVHLHGDHHPSASDGQPDSKLIKPGGRRTYVYPLTDSGKPEPAAFDFYHDHRMGSTGRANWFGLQGMFLIDSARQSRLHLPRGKRDVPLMVTDRSFDSLNQLTDPFSATSAGPFGANTPPGDATVGQDILVNGTYSPHLDVKAQRYRFRLLNASNFSSYDFALSGGMSFTQIGTGDSLLPKPVRRQDIVLGPAQRADVVVDFSHHAHKQVILRSIARKGAAPAAIGTAAAPIMQFRVGSKTADSSHVPSKLPTPAPVAAASAPTAVWVFGLGGSLQGGAGLTWTVNGQAYDPKRIDMTVPLGSTQTWLLVNLSTITHYIHLHEEQWHTIQVNGARPPPWEDGLVDTWEIDPGQSVEVAAKVTDFTGVFMLHCHMLDHEDHGMMAQFAVTKGGSSGLPLSLTRRGYYLATGTTTPAGLAKVPFTRAIELAADKAAGVRPTAHMREMGMAGMPGMTATAATATLAPSGWSAAGARLARSIGVVFALSQLFALLAWRRGRIRSPRLPVGFVVRSVRP
ncbi:MAG TPA: multicopper oxidase domain-containing protein [Mycobacteriales bacterium]|nr:multicopper oxidase domain-containing protein [Mycobacteriales bacterium]